MIDGILTKPEPTKDGLSLMIKAALADFAKSVPMFMQPVHILSETEYKRLTGEGQANVVSTQAVMLRNLAEQAEELASALRSAEGEAWPGTDIKVKSLVEPEPMSLKEFNAMPIQDQQAAARQVEDDDAFKERVRSKLDEVAGVPV